MCATYTIDKKTLPLSDLSEKNNLLHFNACYLICETMVRFFANAPIRYTYHGSKNHEQSNLITVAGCRSRWDKPWGIISCWDKPLRF